MPDHPELIQPIIETRSVDLEGIDFGNRVITLLAVPYEQPTEVMYRQEVWNEVFTRTAFQEIVETKRRVPVTREHNPEALVGKVVQMDPSGQHGLLLDVKISRTDRGDETLQLAKDDCLSASAGFMVKNRFDQSLDRRSMTRRINRAFLDHVSLVGSPAYPGAKVLCMRNSEDSAEARLPRLEVPALDEFLNDPLIRWAADRLK